MHWVNLGSTVIFTILTTGILQNGISAPVNSFGLMSARKTRENGKPLKRESADLPREEKLTAENPERSSHEHELEDIEKVGSLTRNVLQKIHETDIRTEPKSVVLQKRLVYNREGDYGHLTGADNNHVLEQPGSKILPKRLMNNRPGDENGRPIGAENYLPSKRKIQIIQKRPMYVTTQDVRSHLSDSVKGREEDRQTYRQILQKRLVYNREGDNGQPIYLNTPLPRERESHIFQKRPEDANGRSMASRILPQAKQYQILLKRLINYGMGDTIGPDTKGLMHTATMTDVSPNLKALLALRDRVKFLHEKIDNAIDTRASSEKDPSPLRSLSSFKEAKTIPPEFPSTVGDHENNFRALYTEGKAENEQEGFDWLKQGHQVSEDIPASRLTSNDESAEHKLAEVRLQDRQWQNMQDVEFSKNTETSLKKPINDDIKRQSFEAQTHNRVGDREAMKQPLDTFIHTA